MPTLAATPTTPNACTTSTTTAPRQHHGCTTTAPTKPPQPTTEHAATRSNISTPASASASAAAVVATAASLPPASSIITYTSTTDLGSLERSTAGSRAAVRQLASSFSTARCGGAIRGLWGRARAVAARAGQEAGWSTACMPTESRFWTRCSKIFPSSCRLPPHQSHRRTCACRCRSGRAKLVNDTSTFSRPMSVNPNLRSPWRGP